MILPDINLLIHAHNPESPVHAAARRWWKLDFKRFRGLRWMNPLV